MTSLKTVEQFPRCRADTLAQVPEPQFRSNPVPVIAEPHIMTHYWTPSAGYHNAFLPPFPNSIFFNTCQPPPRFRILCSCAPYLGLFHLSTPRILPCTALGTYQASVATISTLRMEPVEENLPARRPGPPMVVSPLGSEPDEEHLAPALVPKPTAARTDSSGAAATARNAPDLSRRRRGLGFVTTNACTECRTKRAKVSES